MIIIKPLTLSQSVAGHMQESVGCRMESAQEGKHIMILATCNLFPATLLCTRRLDAHTGRR